MFLTTIVLKLDNILQSTQKTQQMKTWHQLQFDIYPKDVERPARSNEDLLVPTFSGNYRALAQLNVNQELLMENVRLRNKLRLVKKKLSEKKIEGDLDSSSFDGFKIMNKYQRFNPTLPSVPEQPCIEDSMTDRPDDNVDTLSANCDTHVLCKRVNLISDLQYEDNEGSTAASTPRNSSPISLLESTKESFRDSVYNKLSHIQGPKALLIQTLDKVESQEHELLNSKKYDNYNTLHTMITNKTNYSSSHYCSPLNHQLLNEIMTPYFKLNKLELHDNCITDNVTLSRPLFSPRKSIFFENIRPFLSPIDCNNEEIIKHDIDYPPQNYLVNVSVQTEPPEESSLFTHTNLLELITKQQEDELFRNRKVTSELKRTSERHSIINKNAQSHWQRELVVSIYVFNSVTNNFPPPCRKKKALSIHNKNTTHIINNNNNTNKSCSSKLLNGLNYKRLSTESFHYDSSNKENTVLDEHIFNIIEHCVLYTNLPYGHADEFRGGPILRPRRSRISYKEPSLRLKLRRMTKEKVYDPFLYCPEASLR